MAGNRVLVVDDDGPENPWLQDDPEKLLSMAGAPMSTTPRGGTHRVFRKPKGKLWRNTVGELADHVDTRSDGGYIVVAPSVVDGKPYGWKRGLELNDGPQSLSEPPPHAAASTIRATSSTMATVVRLTWPIASG